MSRRRAARPQTNQRQVVVLNDFSGGQNDVVHASLLNDNECAVLECASLDQKGTLLPDTGRAERFAANIDANPIAGMGAYYRSDGTSRLLMAAGNSLYSDSPHLAVNYDSQAEWQAGTLTLVDAVTTPGDIAPLEPANPTFARASTAYLSNGTLINTNLPRYEPSRIAGARWRDTFDVDQISTHYTSGGDVLATWAISGGVLTGVSAAGAQSILLRTGLTIADGEIIANVDQASNGGLIARYVDNNNYYLLALSDDSGVSPLNNLRMLHRINGIFTDFAVGTVVWPRGTPAQIRFRFNGSLLEAWFNNVRVIAVTDTTFTSGGVGMRQNHVDAIRFLDFAVHQVTPSIFPEEGVTNLLTANQASVETDLTGLVIHGGGTTLIRDTSVAWQGSASIRVVTDGAQNFQGIMSDVLIPVAHSQTYTFSAWVRGSGNIDLVIHEYTAAGVLIAGSHSSMSANSAWTRHSVTRTFGATGERIRVLILTNPAQAVTFWADGLQLEQRPYATTWQLGGTPRAAESLTIPTAGIFTRGNWAVEGIYTPQIPMNVGNVEKTLFAYEIDASNWLRMRVGVNSEWNFAVMSGGVQRTIASASNAALQGTAYHWMIAGDGTNMRLCVNGAQIGTDTAYTEPVGTMPANLFVGSRPNGTLQANGLIDDLRISNRARTLAEHQAAFSSGQPLTVDEPTTYLLPLNGALTASAGLSDWISPSIDAGTATNTGSGNARAIITVPGLSAVTIASRSSANQATWSAWTTALVDGTLQHPANTFVQVRLRLTRDGANLPRVHSLSVSFDGRPNATLLASNFSSGGNYFFASLLDFAIVVNGIDPPRRFDGANLAVLGGSPPRGQYVAVHKNRAWMLVGSRLHFSDILNINSWPVLNFIDISPNDGDTGTGLLTTGDYLVVTKNRSLWLLVGDTIDNFSIRRISADIGCVAPRSLTMVDNMLSFVGENGVYFSDFSQTVLASERIRQTWHRLNQRRLWQAASSFNRHKLRVALPSDESVANDMVLIYDTIRKAWYIRRNWRASCWVEFTEARKHQTFFGHSERGQVSLIESGQSDHGAGIPFVVETKHMDMGLPQHIKRFRDLMVVVVPGTQTGVLNFRFRVNNGALSAPMPVTIQGSPDRVQRVIRVIPSQVNIVQGHNLAIRIEQSTPNAAIAVHSITLNFFIKGARVSL